LRKEKLPIEENVDIEFEYKLLHFYDRIKPYIKFIITGFILAVLVLVLFIYQKSHIHELVILIISWSVMAICRNRFLRVRLPWLDIGDYPGL